MSKTLFVGLVLIAHGAASAGEDESDAAAEQQITLLGALQEWVYPQSKFAGAQMSDGGSRSRTMRGVKCQAILTTGDGFDKVAEFYEQRFVSQPQEVEAGQTAKEPQAVSIQDVSANRPVQIRVIVVNRAKTSTTLVISRSEGETTTHIAWSHFIRLDVD
jgi:hypothetical protein